MALPRRTMREAQPKKATVLEMCIIKQMISTKDSAELILVQASTKNFNPPKIRNNQKSEEISQEPHMTEAVTVN